MVKSKKILWTVRSCLIVITISVFALSYYYYAPIYYPFSFLDQKWGQVLLYGGILLGITIFTWIFPAPGSIIAIIYGIFRIVVGPPGARSPSIPPALYYLIYGLFLAGAIVYLIIGLKQESSRVKYPPNKKILWAVRFITIAALIAFILVFTVVYPEWWGIVIFVPALLTFSLAWVLPAAGGLLMLAVGITFLCNFYDDGYDFPIKLTAYVLILTFIASGFAHIAISFWGKKGKA
jgi:hypothetical protein